MSAISLLLNSECGFPVLTMTIGAAAVNGNANANRLSKMEFTQALETIKGLDRPRYDAASKKWKAPASTGNLEAIEKSGKVDPESMAAIRETRKAMIEEQRKKEEEKIAETKSLAWFPGTPRDYQVQGFAKCIASPRGFGLTFDMGTGKTWVALSVIRYLLEKKPTARVLVVVNKNGINTWLRESGLYGLKFIDYGNVRNDKRSEFWQSYGLVISSYNILMYIPDIKSKQFKSRFDYIIFDESHYIKEFKSTRTQICMKLSEMAERCYILTGTLYGNAAYDAFTQLYCLDQGKSFGVNYYGFLKTWFRKEGGFIMKKAGKKNDTGKWTLKSEKKEQFKELVSSMVMRVTKDEKSFPLKVHEIIEVPADNKEMNEAYILALKSLISTDEGDYVQLKQRLVKCQQITSGGYYFDSDTTRKIKTFKENRKIESLLELIESITYSNEKVIIWTCFQFEIEMIKAALEKAGYENLLQITGETSQKERKEVETLFQTNPDYKIAICNLQAASESMTLTAARYAVFYSLSFSALKYWQAQDRNHRLGSLDKFQSVVYYYLIHSNLIDRHIYDVLQGKKALSDDLQNKAKRQDDEGSSIKEVLKRLYMNEKVKLEFGKDYKLKITENNNSNNNANIIKPTENNNLF